jgi:hypothetical protein
MATNVTVQEVPPPSPPGPPVSFSPSAGTTFDTATNVWSIGTLGLGASATLQINVPHFGDAQTNCAEVLQSDQFDPDSTPNNGNPAEDDRACSTHLNPSS